MEFVISEPGDDPIIVEGYFAASPEKVFKAWTDPKLVIKWFGQTPNSLHSATIDLKLGGNWCFLKLKSEEKSVGFEGQYLEIEKSERLVFSWAHVTSFADGTREATPFSRVEVNFTAKGKGTWIRLHHCAISNNDARKGIGGGWEAAFTHLEGEFEGM